MEFRQLETFLKVAELKSFSKAAQEIFLTQPTVSEHIRQLEHELHTKLFLRTKRETILTPAGKQFAKHAKKLLMLRRQITLEMGRFSETVEGELVIGASSIPGEYILPPLIGAFQERYPKIRIELQISDSQQAIEWVLERKCEIAFVGQEPNHKLLKVVPFSSDRIAPVINSTHPLATPKTTALRDLQSVPLVLRESGSGTRKAVEQVLSEKGLTWKSFNVALTVDSATAAINAVLSGPFFSFLSLKSIERASLPQRLTLLYVSDFPEIHRYFYRVQGKKELLSPLAQHFIRHLNQMPGTAPT